MSNGSFWQAIPGKVKWLAPSFFLLAMGEAMSAGFLALYVKHLGASVEQLGLFFTGMMVATAMAWVLGGWVSDSLGRIPTLMVGLLLAALGYAGTAAAPAWPWLWLSASVSALGLALAMLSYLAYATTHSAETVRGRITSLFGAGGGLAGMVGAPLAGWLSATFGFRELYGAAATLAAAGFVAALPQWRGETWTPENLHLAGLRHSVVSLWGLATLGGVFTWVFLLDGARDLAFGVSERFIPVYYTEVGRLALTDVGVLGGLVTVGTVVFTPIGGWLADKLGERVGIAVAALTGFVGLALFTSAQGFLGFALATVVFSSARAFMDPAFLSALTKNAPIDKLGLILGLAGTALSILSTPAPTVGGLLYGVTPAAPFWATGVLLLLTAALVWYKLDTVQSRS